MPLPCPTSNIDAEGIKSLLVDFGCFSIILSDFSSAARLWAKGLVVRKPLESDKTL